MEKEYLQIESHTETPTDSKESEERNAEVFIKPEWKRPEKEEERIHELRKLLVNSEEKSPDYEEETEALFIGNTEKNGMMNGFSEL